MKQTSLLAVLILIGSVFTASFLLAAVCDASTPQPRGPYGGSNQSPPPRQPWSPPTRRAARREGRMEPPH